MKEAENKDSEDENWKGSCVFSERFSSVKPPPPNEKKKKEEKGLSRSPARREEYRSGLRPLSCSMIESFSEVGAT